MQIADKIATARSQSQEAARQLEQQTTQLTGARQALEAVQVRQERVTGQWQRWQLESRRSLKAMAALAAKEAEWPLAAGQLEELDHQLAGYSLLGETPPDVPLSLAALAGQQAGERLTKLAQLEELHREREVRATEARIATGKAAEKRSAYDELRRQRDEAQQDVTEARDELANRWRQLHREPESWTGELPDYRLAEIASSALRATLAEYRALVQPVLAEFAGPLAAWTKLSANSCRKKAPSKPGWPSLTANCAANRPNRTVCHSAQPAARPPVSYWPNGKSRPALFTPCWTSNPA